jgi:large subunit ribosomal protein L29
VSHVKPSAIREMTVEEIQARIVELREQLFDLRFRNTMKQLDNPLKIREGRRETARLLTVLREKQRSVKS